MPTNNSAPEVLLNNSDPSEYVKFLIGHFREMMKPLFVVIDKRIDPKAPLLVILKHCLINLNNHFLTYIKQTGNSPTYDGLLNITHKLFIESANKLISDIKEQHPSEYYIKLKACLPLLTDNFHQARYEQCIPLIPSTLCAIAKHLRFKIELAATVCEAVFRIDGLLSPRYGGERSNFRIYFYSELKKHGMSDTEIFKKMIQAENPRKKITEDDLSKEQSKYRKWKHDNKEKLEKKLEAVEIEDVTEKLVQKASATVDAQEETEDIFFDLKILMKGLLGEEIGINVFKCFSWGNKFENKYMNDRFDIPFFYGGIGYIVTELCYVRLKGISEMYEEYLRGKKELGCAIAKTDPDLAELANLYHRAIQKYHPKTDSKLIQKMVELWDDSIFPHLGNDEKTGMEKTLRKRLPQIRHLVTTGELPNDKKIWDLEAADLNNGLQYISFTRKFPEKSREKSLNRFELMLLKIILKKKEKNGPTKYSNEEYLKEILAVCNRGKGWKKCAGISLEISLSQLQRKFKLLCDRGCFHRLREAIFDSSKCHQLREAGYGYLVMFKKVKWTLVPSHTVRFIGHRLARKMYVPDVYWNKKSASSQGSPGHTRWTNKANAKIEDKNNKHPRHMKRKRKKL